MKFDISKVVRVENAQSWMGYEGYFAYTMDALKYKVEYEYKEDYGCLCGEIVGDWNKGRLMGEDGLLYGNLFYPVVQKKYIK